MGEKKKSRLATDVITVTESVNELAKCNMALKWPLCAGKCLSLTVKLRGSVH